MRHRAGEFDMAHALAPDLGQGHFNTTFLTYHAPVLETLVFAAQAFVILDRPEDLGAKQAIAFRFEGTIVNGLGFFYLAIGP